MVNDLFTPTAEKGREIGMLMAEAGAERADPGWGECAFFFLRRYVQFHPEPFMAEDALVWAEKNGLKTTVHKRAWGAVIRRAAKEGLIIFQGYSRTRNPLAHRTPASRWQSNVREY